MSGGRKDLSRLTEKTMRSFLWGNSGYKETSQSNRGETDAVRQEQEPSSSNFEPSLRPELSSSENLSHKSSDDMSVHSSISSDESKGDESNLHESDEYMSLSLKSFLKYWITNFNISRYACNTLLRYINKNIDRSIPKSYITLLETPLQTNLVTVEPGLYHHIGFNEALKMSEIDFKTLPGEATYTLDINVDGLQVK